MKNKITLFLIAGITVLLFSNCRDDSICSQTIYHHDGNGNTWESQLEYPCRLGPPVDAPVNK